MKTRKFRIAHLRCNILADLGGKSWVGGQWRGTDPMAPTSSMPPEMTHLCPNTGVKHLYPQRVPQPETEVKRLFPESLPISLRGWVSGGYVFNGETPGSHFNGPYNEVDRNRPELNQLYFIAEKNLSDKEGIDLGGRFDVLFGNDFFLAQSNGLERTEAGRQNGTSNYMVSRFRKCMPKSATRNFPLSRGTSTR